MTITERAAYIKGLAEGLGIDDSANCLLYTSDAADE